MSTKIRVNREFASLQEAADYFNYFLTKHPDARISLTDLKKVADKNGWTMEDQAIDNNTYRTVMSDDEGYELGIMMVPHFDVFQPDTEDGPEDDESDDSDEEETEEETEESEEDAEEEPTTEEIFAWVQPGETFVWRDPNDDSEHSAEVVEVKSEDGKVHTTNTEIRAKVEGVEGIISIFCDEIVMLDGDEEEEESDEESEDDTEESDESDESDEIEDAEIVEDQSDAPDTPEESEESDDTNDDE